MAYRQTLEKLVEVCDTRETYYEYVIVLSFVILKEKFWSEMRN